MIAPGIYRHFKGNVYEVIGVAMHSETGEEMVVYRPLQAPDRLWVRPTRMWTETVNQEGYAGPRFAYLAPSVEALDASHGFVVIERIAEAFETSDFDNLYGPCSEPFFDKASRTVVWLGGEDDPAFDPDDVPESLIYIPKFPDDAYELMRDFVYESIYAIRDRAALEQAIAGKGAFRRFKDTVRRCGIEEFWYAYRDMRLRRAAREFCSAHDIAWAMQTTDCS